MHKILICGPYPKPVGGISIHIERLSHLLTKNNFSISICDESAIRKEKIFNIRSLSLKKYLGLLSDCNTIHIHSSVALFRFVHIFFALLLRKKIFVTIHSWRSGKLSSLIWGMALDKLATKVVLVSNEISRKLPISESKLEITPAFLPPQSSSEVPCTILKFIKKSRENNKAILVSNAFRLSTYNDQDLYGLDLCIDIFDNSEIRDKAVLIFVISDPEHNREKINEYTESIKSKNLLASILIHSGSIDYFSLLMHADTSIRATNTDGDALSVRESIYLGVPCISSNCVDRPEEAILFESRSATSLADKILEVITSEKPAPHKEPDDYFYFYKKLYLGL